MPTDQLSREETKDDAGTRVEKKPWWWRLSVFVLDHAWLLVGAIFALSVLLLVLGSLLGWNIEIPRWVQVVAGTAAISFLTVGLWVKKRTLDLLWDPSWIWVVNLSASETGKGGIYRWPSQQFRELSVEEGQLDWCNPTLAFARDVNLPESRLVGTWRGTLSDRELLLKIENIKECRGRLEEDAKRGFSIEAQAHSIIRVAAQRAVLRIVDTFERATLPDDGEALSREIDRALDSFDLDDHVRESFDDLEDEMPDLDDDLDAVRNGETNDVEQEAPADD